MELNSENEHEGIHEFNPPPPSPTVISVPIEHKPLSKFPHPFFFQISFHSGIFCPDGIFRLVHNILPDKINTGTILTLTPTLKLNLIGLLHFSRGYIVYNRERRIKTRVYILSEGEVICG